MKFHATEALTGRANVPAAAGITQRLLCLAAATTFGERDGKLAEIRTIHHEVNGIYSHHRIKASWRP